MKQDGNNQPQPKHNNKNKHMHIISFEFTNDTKNSDIPFKIIQLVTSENQDKSTMIPIVINSDCNISETIKKLKAEYDSACKNGLSLPQKIKDNIDMLEQAQECITEISQENDDKDDGTFSTAE